jgi:hypothetical protein
MAYLIKQPERIHSISSLVSIAARVTGRARQELLRVIILEKLFVPLTNVGKTVQTHFCPLVSSLLSWRANSANNDIYP